MDEEIVRWESGRELKEKTDFQDFDQKNWVSAIFRKFENSGQNRDG
jgi:hypothetical protein